tara:strand:- start:4848 stop:5828 length:981 start_codon:yes stop_codon:yes gene_type:complete
MGGDNSPEVTVAGAILSTRQNKFNVLLVGDKASLEKELSKHDTENLSIKIIPSEGKIEDSEAPALGLRQKPKASIVVATSLVKKGEADAVVSMGSTGATMAAAVVLLGTIDGIDRPAIGGPIVGSAPNQVILDLGSNLDCKPQQLVGFGVLGSVFSQDLLKIPNPKIGLLSVGSEEGKGNSQIKEATELFKKSGLNFIGNIEGNDLVTGKADIVVCDGFVGNVVLKLVESLSIGLANQLQTALTNSSMPTEVISGLMKKLISDNNVVDARGGGPIFGVNGVSIIGHGSASADTVHRAIEMAAMCVSSKLIEGMNKQVPDVMASITN